MTQNDARKKLEKAGYKVVYSGRGYMATKALRTFRADTLNGLVNKIFKQEWK